jgi:hypothetical protein
MNLKLTIRKIYGLKALQILQIGHSISLEACLYVLYTILKIRYLVQALNLTQKILTLPG